MEEEAVNTDVAQDEANVSDSPSDEQATTELSEVDRLKRENQELKQNLRNQSKKRSLGDDEPNTGEVAPTNEVLEKLNSLEERFNEVVEKRTEKTSEYKNELLNQMYDTDWGKKYAPETPGNDRAFAKFNTELKRLMTGRSVESKADMYELMKRAHVVATGDTRAMLDTRGKEAEAAVQQQQASAASGPSGSTNRDSQHSANSLSAEENAFLDKFGVSEGARKNI